MSENETAPKTVPKTVPKKGRWWKRSLAVVFGLLVGLIIAEAAFWFRDDGGFPHVNFYVPDAELGVRLEPGATMRLNFQDNPVTDIRVNAQGYRGADHPSPRANEILTVGDSQVFGLGVEEQETFSAQLAELTGRPVINGGVPTYGPLEYNAVVKEMLESRHPTTVVYVLNMANDWFETDRPNRERHTVWDGWAVRSETAPESYLDFPGRELLFRKSHAFYALRRFLYEQGPVLDDRGFESEGTWTDLLSTSQAAAQDHQAADDDLVAQSRDLRTRRAKLGIVLGGIEDQIDREVFSHDAAWDPDRELRLLAARGTPGDIVGNADVEEGREIALTARIIRQGVRLRNSILRQRAASREGGGVEALLARRAELEDQREALRAQPLQRRFVPSVLAPRLRELKALCDQHEAELLVVALPLDVQVSSDEWEKYGVDDPPEMAETRVLLTDLVHTAERLGARGVDLTDALAAAEPGAFLRGDIHLTAKGHRAAAEAIDTALRAPPPLRVPDGGLPDGRSRVPSADDWLRTPEAIVRGSSRAGCQTIRFREWMRISCIKQGRRNVPTGAELLSGGRGEASIVTTEEATTLIAPLLPGDEVTADFHWVDRTQRLVLRRQNEEEAMFFEDARDPEQPTLDVSDDAARLCACHVEVLGEAECVEEEGWPTGECRSTCVNLFGAPTTECMNAYRDNCLDLLRCVQGDPLASPPCPEGSANAGATGQCFALCDAANPCAEGTCVSWQGAHICRP
ncbi:MAG: hypothetical protein AAGF12_13465 [Myxococcota bacterium]